METLLSNKIDFYYLSSFQKDISFSEYLLNTRALSHIRIINFYYTRIYQGITTKDKKETNRHYVRTS